MLHIFLKMAVVALLATAVFSRTIDDFIINPEEFERLQNTVSKEEKIDYPIKIPMKMRHMVDVPCMDGLKNCSIMTLKYLVAFCLLIHLKLKLTEAELEETDSETDGTSTVTAETESTISHVQFNVLTSQSVNLTRWLHA
ncbi:hypothetical protein HUJ04_012833 [Dendroctonus ponderosae]|nr:hypothetical protein HUJ04_012833 [Dendroctonus ponderosae]